MNLYQKIKQDLVPILSEEKTIGFMLSGGFDSGLLLYICCKIKLEENLNSKFVLFTVPYEDSLELAYGINDYIARKFNLLLNINTVGQPTMHHSIRIMFSIPDALKSCDYLLLGDTSNPPVKLDGDEPKRIRSTYANIVQPFFDYTKKDTVALCIELNFTELMKLSRSCAHPHQYVCNECWFCKERAWGFSQNMYIDNGI